MQITSKVRSFAIAAGLCILLTLGFLTESLAENKNPAPAGTWIGKGPGSGGGPDSKMRLNLYVRDGDKLFGVLTEWTPLGDPIATGIYDGKVTGHKVSFTVVNVLNETTCKYKGKVSGHTIEGEVEIAHGEKTATRKWTANRETSKNKS